MSKKRVKFYGQCLDEETCRAVLNEFYQATLSYSIGDGMKKLSRFNMKMGRRLTGLRLPS